MKTTVEFFLYDFAKTLFPLETCRFLIKVGEDDIRTHISRCLSNAPVDANINFLPQTRVYATKPRNHLRRTHKLDPVAEFYFYDTVFSNRRCFRRHFLSNRKHFGYRFKGGEPISSTEAYSQYNRSLASFRKKYSFHLSFDIASYFNSVYHHDIVDWYANLQSASTSAEDFSQYLRQINSGRSIDCLPHGLYPGKMIGGDFLRFVEQHHALKSAAILRFMDDINLFSDEESTLWEDFYLIQVLLGEKGLSINPAKTTFSEGRMSTFEDKVSEVKTRLLKKRRIMIIDYDEKKSEARILVELDREEMKYVRYLLQAATLEEDDAELVLSIFREHPEEVAPHLRDIAIRFPHLSKNIWSFSKLFLSRERRARFGPDYLASLLKDIVAQPGVQEYQLFWFGHMLQDYLLEARIAPEIIETLYNHKNATILSKAKLLEIADSRYGLMELRDQHLMAGRSDWLAWASAVGHRRLPKIARNHKLSYFANSSSMNELVGPVIMRHDG